MRDTIFNMRKLFYILTALILGLTVCGPALAEDISFEASVDTDTVELGSSLQLTLTVSGADAMPPIELPKIDGLETRYLGPSTQISIINGQMSRTTAAVFTVIPLQTGEFTIPAVTITVNGKDYSSRPVTFKVVGSGTLSPQSTTSANNTAAGLQDRIFIVLGTSKNEAYLNEPIPLVIKLFINDLQVKNIQFPTFAHDGFAADPFPEPRRYNQSLGGVNYHVIEFKTFIYPTRTGDLTVGPAKLNANILIKSSRRSRDPFDRFGSIFEDEFFEGILGAYDVKGVTLGSAELGIKVLPLPEEGKPQDFSGAVGKYEFDMTVSPSEVKVGDPLTVRMKVSGYGNLKAVTMPAYSDSKDFRAYDPKIGEENSVKTLEQVVIPNHAGVSEVPAVRFSYFDPDEKTYRTITKGPFSVKVEALPKGEEAKVVGLAPGSAVTAAPPVAEELGRDIRYIKEDLGRSRRKGEAVYQNFIFIGFLTALILGWPGLWIGYGVQERLKTDVRFARRLQAPRQARLGLARAKDLLEENDSRGFYDVLFKTLQDYLGNKFHLSSGGVTVEAVRRVLPADNKSQTALGRVREIFEECEFIRYASGVADTEKMKTALRLTEETIDLFERNFR